MALTPAQAATLKTDIQSQGSLTTAVAAADWFTVAAFYNAASATQMWIPNLPVSVVLAATNWAAFALKTVQVQNTYLAMTSTDVMDATNANIRAGFQAVFSGGDLTALSNIAQRAATRLEALFGAGGPPIVSTLFGYTLTADDVQKAMA